MTSEQDHKSDHELLISRLHASLCPNKLEAEIAAELRYLVKKCAAREPLTKEKIMELEELAYVDSERPVFTTDAFGDEVITYEPTKYFNIFMFTRAVENFHGIGSKT